MTTARDPVVFGEPIEVTGEPTHRRLLTAAEAVFGECGYDAASVAQIVREAGVAEGAFYVYFPSKKAAFAALIEDFGKQLRLQLSDATARHHVRLQIERAAFGAWLAFSFEHRNLVRILHQAQRVDEALHQQVYRSLALAYRDSLRRATDRGELVDADLEAIAYTRVGIFESLSMRWIIWEGAMPPKRVLDDVLTWPERGTGPTKRRG